MARSREMGGIAALLVIGVTAVLVLTAAVAVALGKLMVALASPSGGAGPDASASTFMAANAAFSGLALAAVLVTFAVQQRKARHHRRELTLQRRELTRTHAELYRSAEADVRAVHVELLKIAIENPELISVWPGFESIPAERGRELLYTNLVFAQHLLAFRLDNLRPSEMRGHLRVLVQSTKFREYWEFTRPHRAVLDPDSDEVQFGRLVDAAVAEYEQGRSIQP
ncbi:DUF6082 family protein [Streptomyces sp. NPDC001070]